MEKEWPTQAMAEQYISAEKFFVEHSPISMPDHINYKQSLELVSFEPTVNFMVDIVCSRDASLLKGANQLRLGSFVLLRLDYNVKNPHKNPDGKIVQGSHLHRYIEGFRERWAIRPPETVFSEFTDRKRTLREFLKYCNVVDVPIFGVR